MVRYACHVHTTRVLREVGKPPHYLCLVSPAGVGEKCDVCGKPAIWTVNVIE